MADADILDSTKDNKEAINQLKISLFKYLKIIGVLIPLNLFIQIVFFRIGELNWFLPKILFSNLVAINLIGIFLGLVFGKITF